MREGLDAGFTLPQVVLEGLRRHDAEPTSWTTPRRASSTRRSGRFPAGVPEAERARLTAAGRAAVMDGVVAGYRDARSSS